MAEYRKLGKYIRSGDVIGGRRVVNGVTDNRFNKYVASLDDGTVRRFPLDQYVLVETPANVVDFAPVTPAVVDKPQYTQRQIRELVRERHERRYGAA